ncbi:hypothetical protein ACTXT7_003109 [Hymenolepis weldensis]
MHLFLRVNSGPKLIELFANLNVSIKTSITDAINMKVPVAQLPRAVIPVIILVVLVAIITFVRLRRGFLSIKPFGS